MKGKGKDMSKVELTETQKNIIQIRKRMNRRSIEEEKFNGFYKKENVDIFMDFPFHTLWAISII